MEKNKKTSSPSLDIDKKVELEDKNQKNANKKPLSQTAIGENEFEETRSDEVRMKPQPFEKKK